AQTEFDTHKAAAQPSSSDEVFVKFYLTLLLQESGKKQADSLLSGSNSDSLRAILAETHPPAWARLELAEQYLAEHPDKGEDAVEASYLRLGLAVMDHSRRIADTILVAWLGTFREQGGMFEHIGSPSPTPPQRER